MRQSRIRQHYEDPRSSKAAYGKPQMEMTQSGLVRGALTPKEIFDERDQAETNWNQYMSKKKELDQDWQREITPYLKLKDPDERALALNELARRPKYWEHIKEVTRLWNLMEYWRKRAEDNGVSLSKHFANTEVPYWLQQISPEHPGNPQHEAKTRDVFLMGKEKVGFAGGGSGGFRKRSSVVKMGKNPLGGGE